MTNRAKHLLTLVVLLSSLSVFGQITTMKVADIKESPEIMRYDSTRNFLGNDVRQYIGQELYLSGKVAALRGYGYSDFYLKPNASAIGNVVYKCCSDRSKYNSKYEELSGKYFKVLDVLKSTRGYPEFDLKLQEKVSGDIIYFAYTVKFSHTFPFTVVGFFEKLKTTGVGQTFIIGQMYNSTDIKTGKAVNLDVGKEWECIDVTFVENKDLISLSYILKDRDGQTIRLNYDYRHLYTKTEAMAYKEKFSEEFWNLILQGKVRLGMTTEMCILSWGKPKKVNETISSVGKTEQWIYDNNYLYFTNGILTTMQ